MTGSAYAPYSVIALKWHGILDCGGISREIFPKAASNGLNPRFGIPFRQPMQFMQPISLSAYQSMQPINLCSLSAYVAYAVYSGCAVYAVYTGNAVYAGCAGCAGCKAYQPMYLMRCMQVAQSISLCSAFGLCIYAAMQHAYVLYDLQQAR